MSKGRKVVQAIEKGLIAGVRASRGFFAEVVETLDEVPKAAERIGQTIDETVEKVDAVTEPRHWIYIGRDYWGPTLPQDPGYGWHWAEDADSYGDDGKALCGRVFPGSPLVSREGPDDGFEVCAGCSEALRAKLDAECPTTTNGQHSLYMGGPGGKRDNSKKNWEVCEGCGANGPGPTPERSHEHR